MIGHQSTIAAWCKLTLRRVSRKGILDFVGWSSLALASHMSTDSRSANTQLMPRSQIEALLCILLSLWQWILFVFVFYRFRALQRDLSEKPDSWEVSFVIAGSCDGGHNKGGWEHFGGKIPFDDRSGTCLGLLPQKMTIHFVFQILRELYQQTTGNTDHLV